MKIAASAFTALLLLLHAASAGWGATAGAASSRTVLAGEPVTVEGTIPPGEELYAVVATQRTFAPGDTPGTHESQRLRRDAVLHDFDRDTRIPSLYYLLTTDPGAFGSVARHKFGGPAFLTRNGRSGLYTTNTFRLADFDQLAPPVRSVLGPLKTREQWNFFRYAHQDFNGIDTIVKETTRVGAVAVFARSVLQDFTASGQYWDAGTTITLDKVSGRFKATFHPFRHTPPDTSFDVYVNGRRSDSFRVAGNGFWLSRGGRYMNPLWIALGALFIGIFFSLVGASGGMLMAAFQAIAIQTAGPLGIDAANVLRPSNIALPLFSSFGAFYRYAIRERRVAWPVGLSFGVGLLLGSFWLGKYVTPLLPMETYRDWLAVLLLLMGARTVYELTPRVRAKHRDLKAGVDRFNAAVAKAQAEGRSIEMSRIEPVRAGLADYRFRFWGEEFTINPVLFGLLGLGIGMVSRSFGIGGGFLLIPALTVLGALPLYIAVPISLVGTCFASVGAFLGYLSNDYRPDLWLMLAIIVGGFAGGMLGSRVQKLFGEKALKLALAAILFLLALRFLNIEIWI